MKEITLCFLSFKLMFKDVLVLFILELSQRMWDQSQIQGSRSLPYLPTRWHRKRSQWHVSWQYNDSIGIIHPFSHSAHNPTRPLVMSRPQFVSPKNWTVFLNYMFRGYLGKLLVPSKEIVFIVKHWIIKLAYIIPKYLTRINYIECWLSLKLQRCWRT